MIMRGQVTNGVGFSPRERGDWGTIAIATCGVDSRNDVEGTGVALTGRTRLKPTPLVSCQLVDIALIHQPFVRTG